MKRNGELNHTKALLEESVSKVLSFLESNRLKELSTSSVENLLSRSTRRKSTLERVINRLGYHLARVETIRELEKNGKLGDAKFWAAQTFFAALSEEGDFDRVFSLLADDPSRATFDWFIKARVALAFLGNWAFDLFPPPIDKQRVERGVEDLSKRVRNGWVSIDGFRLKSDPGVLFLSFTAEQYRLPGLVEPEQGDWIFDIGGCFGETSFWFSKRVGKTGKVFCFEPVLRNYRVLEENLKANKVENIIPVGMAVGDFTGEVRIYGEGGIAAVSEIGSIAPGTTIDEYVSGYAVERVDMIKMDIEGYELNALKGAVETLKRFKPKLAICVYHGGEDLARIPLFIEDLGLGYGMYLRHFTPFLTETILFAIAKYRN